MIEIVRLEPKTYTESVTYVFPCSKIKPIGSGDQVIDSSAFMVVDTTDPVTDLADTMVESASFDPTLMEISAKMIASTGTRGHTYWLVGLVGVDTGEQYKLFGQFKIEDGVGPTITQ